MSEIDRGHLPIRRPAFSGMANRTLQGSQPDWNLIAHPTPPEGAPNVLLVRIDDAGFGNPSTFGGPIQTPNRCHVTALWGFTSEPRRCPCPSGRIPQITHNLSTGLDL
jgi:arylsulfatase